MKQNNKGGMLVKGKKYNNAMISCVVMPPPKLCKEISFNHCKTAAKMMRRKSVNKEKDVKQPLTNQTPYKPIALTAFIHMDMILYYERGGFFFVQKISLT